VKYCPPFRTFESPSHPTLAGDEVVFGRLPPRGSGGGIHRPDSAVERQARRRPHPWSSLITSMARLICWKFGLNLIFDLAVRP